jgi:hypothetical protein
MKVEIKMKRLRKLIGYPGVPLESSPTAPILDIDGLQCAWIFAFTHFRYYLMFSVVCGM